MFISVVIYYVAYVYKCCYLLCLAYVYKFVIYYVVAYVYKCCYLLCSSIV